MVSILEPLRLVHRTHSSTKQHSDDHPVPSRVRGQARILLCDVGRFFENAPLGRLLTYCVTCTVSDYREVF